MKLRTRQFLFVLFLLFFVVAAPLTVLYTAGYRYSFRAGQIVQTGVFSFTSVPRGAAIYIDDELQSSRTPAVIKNIIPGQHTIRLERTGYSTWQKTLEVQSHTTTFADGITLFPLTTPNLALAFAPDASATIHKKTDSIAHLKRDDEWTEVWIYRGGTEQLVSRLPLAPTVPIHIDWSADGTTISLTVGETRPDRLLVSLLAGTSLDLSDVYRTAESGWWDPRIDGRYFVRTPEGVWDAGYPTGLNSILHKDLQALTIDNDEYIVLQSVEDRTAVSIQQATSVGTLLTYLPRGAYVFAEAPSWLSLLVEPTRGELILLDRGHSEPIRLTAQATAWEWDAGQNRLLYTDGFELHVYDRQNGTNETITRVSDPIIDVAWDTNGASVFFAQKTNLFAVELDRRDDRNMTTIISADNIEHLWTSVDGKNVFVLGTIGGEYGMWKKAIQ